MPLLSALSEVKSILW